MASPAARIAYESGGSIHAPHLQLTGDPRKSWVLAGPCGALSTRVVQELDSIMFIKDLEAGETLFLEREPPSRVFVVISGDVRLSIEHLGGRRLTFQLARQGAVLGMGAALFNSRCEWSAEALHSTRVGVIAREEFVRFAARHPEVYRIASAELIQTVRAACSALRIIGLNSCIRKRVALQLLEWGERGSKDGDQTQFRMTLTHEQIAEFIGSVRESVTRALIAFKQLRLIDIHGSMVRIPSTTALRKYAESA